MNVDFSRPWKEVFALVAEAAAEEKRLRLLDIFEKERDRQDKDKLRVKEKHEKEKEEGERAFEEMLATTERIAEFSTRLDDLDTASVKALMDNGEALDHMHLELARLLAQSDTLPDGRHVFKTMDGQRVFDEHGAAVPADVINPHAFNDRFTRWETFKTVKDQEHTLQVERHDLLEYQSKLDSARTRLDKGSVTNKDLDALDADLKASMPDAVRKELDHGAGKPGFARRTAADLAPTRPTLDEVLRFAASCPSPM